MVRKYLALTFILVLGLALLGDTAAMAQSVLEGKVTGTVADDKGELLPGVNVELSGPAIMGKRATVTSARGTFVFLNVPPGRFTLTASLPGFKTSIQENILLGAGSTIDIKVALEIGAIEEQVTVLAASPVVDVKTSTVDSRLDNDMLTKLPTTRDAFYDLALTTPGMFDVGSSNSWLPSPTAYGGSSMENVFLVNGVNTTNPRGAAFGSLVKVNYNAVEEVRVVALGSRAEYGSFSGAAIDVLTKSGSNTFHGNAAYYTELRGDTFFKPNYPLTDFGDPNTPLSGQHDWLFYQGGDRLAGTTMKNWEGNFTLGGPIVKDKVWFYGAFDYIRSASLPVNWAVLNEYYGRYADLKISAEPIQNTRAWVSYHREWNKGSGWSWGTQPEWDTTATYGVDTKNDTLSAQFQWLPSSTTILTAKYLGFWTDDQPFVPADGPSNPVYINWWKWGTQYGVAGAFPYVEAQKSNRQTFQADVTTYVEEFLGEHDIKFGVQYTKGRGNWMGGYFQNYANFAYPLGGWWGYYNGLGYSIDALKTQTWYYGNAFADGLLFYNNKISLNPFLTVRTADSMGLFIDDQWSPTKRLTLNLGFRFDRMTTKYGEGKVFDPLTQPSDINDPNLGVLRTRVGTDNIFDFKTFSPRLGATYQLTKDGKTVLRANYGRYYMPLAVEFLRRFGPDMPTTVIDYQVYMVPWAVADIDGNGYIDNHGVSGVNELREAVRYLPGQTPIGGYTQEQDSSWTLQVADNVKDTYTDQFSLNLERELFKNVSLSATYIYKHTANLFVNVPINRVTGQEWAYDRVPFDPAYGDPIDLYSVQWLDYDQNGVIDGQDIVYIGTNGTFRVENMQSYAYTEGGDLHKPQRTYEALQLVFNKRYSERWQGLASMVYSWSNGTAQRTMRQNDNMMGPMITDDTWMGTLNYTVNNMTGVLPFVPKWEIKASGSYTLPGIDADLGLRFRFHTGRPIWRLEPYAVATQWGQPAGSVIPGGGTSRVVSSTTPTYLPSLSLFDFRAEKAFRLARYGSIHVVLDIFNVFNSSNVVQADFYGNWGRITGLSDARRFRLSFMYQF